MKFVSHSLGFLVVSLAVALPVHGQQKDAAFAEDTVVLSVFEVSAAEDIGYRAATTLAGTRTGEEIKNVPQVITVMTEDFIKDIGATDVTGLMPYATGVAYRPSSSFDVNSFQFRGLDSAFQSRNFFLWYMPSDAFSTDRVDIVRGPNTILFGDSDPGGMLNIETKRAHFTNRATVGLRVGSWNQVRATADLNHAVSQKLALRVNLLRDDKDNWERWVGQTREGVHLALTFLPWKDARLRVEAEYANLVRHVAQTIPLDAYSEWDDATPFTFNTTAAPAGTNRLTSAAGANYWIWDNSGGTLANWRGFGQTNRVLSDSDAVKDTSIHPKGAHFVGPDWRHDFEYHTYTMAFEQRWGDNLNLELVFNNTTDTVYRRQAVDDLVIRRDPNLTMPGGAANPHFGDYYLEYQWQRQRNHHDIPEGRMNVVYDWQPVDWMKQRFFFNAGAREEVTTNRVFREVIVNNPAEPRVNQATNQVRRRVYLEEGDDLPNINRDSPIADASTGLRSDFRNTQQAVRNTNHTAQVQLSASGEYLDGRFRTLIGVRRDNLRSHTQQGVRDPSTGENILANGVESLRFVGWNTSLTYGGIWQPRPELTFFATRGESYRPVGFAATLLDDSTVGPRLGQGVEGGVRLDLAQGRFYIQASAFDMEQKNRVYSLETSVTTAINNLWTAVDSSRVTTGTSDRQTLGSKGFELEAWINLLPGWTTTLGFGVADAEVSEIATFTRGYIQENMPEWQAYIAANPGSAAQLNPQIATLENFLATVVPGTRPEGSYEQSWNVFTKYTVQSGRAKGLSVGLGVSHNGGSVRYNAVTDGVVTPIYGESSTLVNALVGYEKRLSRRLDWSVALNVQNLLDEEYLLETSRTMVAYGEPRSWTLTTTISF